MYNFLIVCGYANAGKTTLLKKLKNVNICSTSVVLDYATARVIRGLFQLDAPIDTIARGLQQKTVEIQGLTSRELKISMAEEVIVPTFGRAAIVRAALEQAKVDDLNIMESIGGEELTLLLGFLNERRDKYKVVNLRSPDELKGVDIRELAGKGLTEDLGRNPLLLPDFWVKKNTGDAARFKKYVISEMA